MEKLTIEVLRPNLLAPKNEELLPVSIGTEWSRRLLSVGSHKQNDESTEGGSELLFRGACARSIDVECL